MSLPKWAKAQLAWNKLHCRILDALKKLNRDEQDCVEGVIYEAWRMGYRAGQRQAKQPKPAPERSER
jgi:hypothetical protein